MNVYNHDITINSKSNLLFLALKIIPFVEYLDIISLAIVVVVVSCRVASHRAVFVAIVVVVAIFTHRAVAIIVARRGRPPPSLLPSLSYPVARRAVAPSRHRCCRRRRTIVAIVVVIVVVVVIIARRHRRRCRIPSCRFSSRRLSL